MLLNHDINTGVDMSLVSGFYGGGFGWGPSPFMPHHDFRGLRPPVINSSLSGEIQQMENQVNQTMFLNLIETIKETVNEPISSLWKEVTESWAQVITTMKTIDMQESCTVTTAKEKCDQLPKILTVNLVL